MYQQLEKELSEFEKAYRAYGEGKVNGGRLDKYTIKENVEKTAAWVAATLLLKHLKKVNKNVGSV